MNEGTIALPNQKGQVVIPRNYRKILGITPTTPINILLWGGGLYLFPVKEAMIAMEEEPSYLKILERTKGTWGSEDGASINQRNNIELKASSKRRQSW